MICAFISDGYSALAGASFRPPSPEAKLKAGGKNEMRSLLPASSSCARESMDTKAEALYQKGYESSSMSALIAVSRLLPPLGATALPLPAPPLAPLPPPFGTNWMSSAMTSVEWPFLPSLPSQSRKDSLPKTMTVLPFCSHSLAVFAVWPKHKQSYQSVTLLSSLPRFTATGNFTPSDFPLRPSKLNTSGSLPKLPINCTFANPISFPLSAPVGALYFFCGPNSPDWPAPVDRDLVRRSDSCGARRCLCLRRTLFAGSRQLLQLSLFVDNEPANHDCCELVPEHLCLRQESLDLGFLAGV